MASSSESLTSCHTSPTNQAQSRLTREKKLVNKQDKKWPIVDEYRYLNVGLLRQQMPWANGQVMINMNMLAQQHGLSKKAGRVKTNMNESDATYLAKEMGLVFGSTTRSNKDGICHLIRSSINNLVAEKQPTATGLGEAVRPTNNKQYKATQKQRLGEQQPAPTRATNSPVSVTSTTKQTPKANKRTGSTAGPGSKSVTRAQIQAPDKSVITNTNNRKSTIRVIESSNTNILHRCYGKQNVKVLPQGYKVSRKSNNYSPRHNIVKTPRNTTPNSSLKQKPSSSNQQMKTIYENNQFVKLEPTETSSNVSVTTSTNSLQQKESTANNNNWLETKDDSFKQTDQLEIIDDNVCVSVVVEPSEFNQDNSLVHRLTTFWNMKLNTNRHEKTVCEEACDTSVTSSLTSTNSCKDIADGLNKHLRPKTVQDQGSKSGELDGEIYMSDMKIGVVDELIKVLQGNDNSDPSSCETENKITALNDKKSCDKIETLTLNNETKEINSDSASEYEFSEDMEEEEEEGSDNEDGTDNSCTDQSELSTMEATETCILSEITLCNLNNNKYCLNNIDEEESDAKTTTTGVSSMVSCLDDTEIFAQANQMEGDKALSKIEGKESCYIVNSSIVEDCKSNVNNDKESENDKNKLLDGITDAASSNPIVSTVTNENNNTVNSYKLTDVIDVMRNNTSVPTTTDIKNLIVNLLHSTKPNDLEIADLANLKLSGEIEQTVNNVVKCTPTADEIMSVDTDDCGDSLSLSPANCDTNCRSEPTLKETAATNESKLTSKPVVTKENQLVRYYLPSTFTLPTFENTAIPIQKLKLPKREDYLNSQVVRSTPDSDEKECNNTQEEDDLNDEVESISSDVVTHVTRYISKSAHESALQYTTCKPKGMKLTTRCPSIMFHPLNKRDLTNYLNKCRSINEEALNSNVEVRAACSNSCSTTTTVAVATTEENNKDIMPKGFVDAELDYESNGSMSYQGTTNKNLRKSRLTWQTDNPEESTLMTGGAGDHSCAGSTIPVPCLRTSSMSVMASGSVNDSNSQPDISINDSHGQQRPAVDINNATIDAEGTSAIQLHEEHLSDIEDCIMENYDNAPDTFQVNSCASQPTAGSDVTVHSDTLSVKTQDKSTSTTGLNSCTKKVHTRDIGTITKHPLSPNTSCTYSNNCEYGDGRLSRDYIVFYCQAGTQEPHDLLRSKKDATNHVNNVTKLFSSDTNLHDQLSESNICEREHELMAVCLLLLKRNDTVESTLMAIILHAFYQKLATLWTNTKRSVIGKVSQLTKDKLPARLVFNYERYLLHWQYRKLIKIVYTIFISLTLCFLMQKNICGVPLPVRFPW